MYFKITRLNLVGVFVLLSYLTYGNVIYVNDNASGANNGMSWANAYNDLQQALLNAMAGDTIVVAAGIYKPHASDREVAFELKESVVMLGGFNGNESPIDASTLTNRDFESNASILSGDLSGDDNNNIRIDEPSRSENSHHPVMAVGQSTNLITSATVLDGFTLTGGHADNSSGANDLGGGIYMIYANATLKNLNVHSNVSLDQGGGVFVAAADPLIENCTIENNTCQSIETGGILYGGGISLSNSSATIRGCVIRKNKLLGGGIINGGGLYVRNLTPLIENCVFEGNLASNTSSNSGGAIYTRDAQTTFRDILVINNHTIDFDSSAGGPAGLYVRDGSAVITNATFTLNSGASVGNGIYLRDSDADLTNVLIWGNEGEQALYPRNDGDTARVSHSLIAGSGGSANWTQDGGVDLGNNFDEDPWILTDAANGSADLVTGSVALGSGNVTFGTNIGYYQGSGVASPSTLSHSLSNDSFGLVFLGQSSGEQTLTVSGADLFGAITFTAPDGFWLSTSSGAGFSGQKTLVLDAIDGIVATTDIYVKFVPETVQMYNEEITISTPTIVSETIEVSGESQLPPSVLTISLDTLDFGPVQVGQASQELSYTIAGENLLENVTVTAPEGFEISLQSGNFSANNLELEHDNGELSVTTIFVRFTPQDTSHVHAPLSHLSGVLEDSVVLLADGINPVINANVNMLDFGIIALGDTSQALSFDIWGYDIFNDITFNLSSSEFYMSSDGVNFGLSNAFSINAPGAVLDTTTYYVVFNPQDGLDATELLSVISAGIDAPEIELNTQTFEPHIELAPAELDFGFSYIGVTSPEQSLEVSASELVGGLMLIAPPGFELTQTAGDYGGNTDTLILSPAINGDLSTTELFVRFTPQSIQSYDAQITAASHAVALASLQLYARGGDPQLALSSTLHDFGDVPVGAFSELFKVKVSGSDLKDTVWVNFPPHYLTGDTVTHLIPGMKYFVPDENGRINDSLCIRATPMAELLYMDTVVFGDGAANTDSLFLQVNGVISSFLQVSPPALVFDDTEVGSSDNQLVFNLKGDFLSDSVFVYPSTNFALSLTEGVLGETIDPLKIATNNGAVDTTVWVTFMPDDAVLFTENILIVSSDEQDTAAVDVSGDAYHNSVITASVDNLDFGNVGLGTSKVLSYTFSGSSLSAELTLSTQGVFEISLDSANWVGNGQTLSVPNANDTIIKVWVSFEPLSAFFYSENVVHMSDGANTVMVALSGQGLRRPRIYVKEAASGAETGFNWTDAYTSLQAGIAASRFGDTIFVAQGVYTPSSNDRTATFEPKNGVKMIGGFVGDEPINSDVIANRDMKSHASVLSGDLNNDDHMDVHSDNSYTVIYFEALNSGFSSNTVLDGFTVRGAYGEGIRPEEYRGGGVYMGAFAEDITVVFNNILFEDNGAREGGAVYITHAANGATNASPSFYNCVFKHNYNFTPASDILRGGAAFFSGFDNNITEPYFEACTFIGNESSYGGACYLSGGYTGNAGTCEPEFVNCTFTENHSTLFGNAIYFSPQDGTANPSFVNVIIHGNTNDNSGSFYRQVQGHATVGSFAPTFEFCLLEETIDSDPSNTGYGVDLGNNISGDPMFVNLDTCDVRLIAGSPALGTGNQSDGVNIGAWQGSGVVLPPSIDVSTDSLHFGAISTGSTSVLSYTISGVHLTESIIVNGSATFMVSLDNVTFSNGPLELVPSNGALNQTVFVQFSPEEAINYISEITHNISDAVVPSVGVGGAGLDVEPPVVYFEEDTLFFGNVVNFDQSDVQAAVLIGEHVVDPLTISVGSAYFASLSPSGPFTSDNIVVTPNADSTVMTTIYVVFVPTTLGYQETLLELETTTLPDAYVLLTGTSINAPSFETDQTVLEFGEWTAENCSDVMSLEFYGTDLIDELRISTEAPFEFSNSPDGPFTTEMTAFPDLNGMVNEVIYVRFCPEEGGDYLADLFFSASGVTHYVGLLGEAAGPNVVYVNQSATGNDDGSSWVDAFTSLYDALNVSLTPPVYIAIAKGTYIPDNDEPFFVPAGYELYGSFNGDEIEIDDDVLANRDFVNNATIISGDVLGDDDGFSNQSDNVYGLMVANASSDSVHLDGLKFVGSNNNSAGNSEQGALYISNGGFNLKNLVFEYNTGILGGGMYAERTTLEMEEVKFHHNRADDGGGAFIRESEGTIFSLVFTNNEAELGAGGLYLQSSTFNTWNSTFANNSAGAEGGAIVYNGSEGNFANVIMYFNTSPNTDDMQIRNGFDGDIGYQFCNIQGTSSDNWNSALGNDGGGNVDGDPLLYSAGNNNVDLSFGSPALFAGGLDLGQNIGYYQGNGVEPNAIVRSSANPQITIYPNPVQDLLRIEVLDKKAALVTVKTLDGYIIKEQSLRNAPTFDLSDLKAGFYLLQVSDENGDVYNTSFIKE